jgi:Tfp pilus assembly protein PilN
MIIARELNLLPPERRRHLARQLIINSMTKFLRGVLWALVVVSLTGVGTIVFLQIWVAFVSTSATVMLKERVGRYQELRGQIAKQNENLGFMADVSSKRVIWSDLFADFYSVMPPGTRVQSLEGSITPNPRLTFSGQAISRSALVVLEDRLKQLPWVSQVEAPNSNLLQRANPLFMFDVVLKADKEEKKP